MLRPNGRVRTRLLPAAAATTIVGAFAAPAANAELKVRSPIVEYREFEFEHNGLYTFDRSKSPLNGQQSYTFEVGYGVTPWWRPEVELETEALPGQNIRLVARTFESTFQLLPQGKYWLDLGFFAEFSHSVVSGEPNEITFGPILQKETPGLFGARALHTLNAFFTKEVGQSRTDRTGGFAAWQSRLLLHPLFEPGVEIYYSVEDLGRPGRFQDQEFFVGPAFTGVYSLARLGLPGNIRYEAGLLFGATEQTPRANLRWRLEYELAF